jgi:flagellar basal-body rod protein FlgB
MFAESGMMRTNYLLEKALDTETVRRKVISDNIANVDVPHFKRREVNFESELKRVIRENEGDIDKYPANVTHDKHIPFYRERDLTEAGIRVNHDYSTSYRNDGNNVDIDREMVDASKNMMRYNAFVTGLNHNFKMLKNAMRVV